jgi:hypothetical protein
VTEPKLCTVYESQGMLEAEVIKGKLEAAGIPVLLRYQSTGLVFGLTVGGEGRVDVQVPEELADQAEALIMEGAEEAPGDFTIDDDEWQQGSPDEEPGA